jgi:hypothetical protein
LRKYFKNSADVAAIRAAADEAVAKAGRGSRRQSETVEDLPDRIGRPDKVFAAIAYKYEIPAAFLEKWQCVVNIFLKRLRSGYWFGWHKLGVGRIVSHIAKAQEI